MFTFNKKGLYLNESLDDEKIQTVRFDPLNPTVIQQEEDEVDEFAEDIGLSKAGTKRKQVRTDVSPSPLHLSKEMTEILKGYDSDSSQEGDSKKPKKKKKADDDNDDMFDDEHAQNEDAKEDDDEDAWGKLKRKQTKFLNYTAFKGQEFQGEEQDLEDEEESIPSTPHESDDEVIDDEVGLAGSKKRPPKIEKFNLRQEQAEGVFTDDGGYIRKAADPRAHQDNWMDGLTKGQIRRAAEGMEKQRQRELEVERREAEEMAIAATERLAFLIRSLKPTETPLKALARLNQEKKKKWQPSQKWKKSKMQVDREDISEEDAEKVKEQIEAITSACDKLLALGNSNIYSTSRERLIMLYQEDTGERFRERPAQQSETNKWEYKWPGTDEVHSSFSSEEMRGWKAGGFFGDGVLCRRAGSEEEWKNSMDIVF
jgi:CD2 antigen cytoplasmic tail-binding protein 2